MAESKGERHSGTVEIENVEVGQGQSPPCPEAQAVFDRLVSKWLVRAYLRRHGSDGPRAEEATGTGEASGS